MALMRGKLFAGALFAGLLFGPQAQESGAAIGTGWPQSFHEAWLEAHIRAQAELSRLAMAVDRPEVEEHVASAQRPAYAPPDLYAPSPSEIEEMYRRMLEAMRLEAPMLAERIAAEAQAEEDAVVHLLNWMME